MSPSDAARHLADARLRSAHLVRYYSLRDLLVKHRVGSGNGVRARRARLIVERQGRDVFATLRAEFPDEWQRYYDEAAAELGFTPRHASAP